MTETDADNAGFGDSGVAVGFCQSNQPAHGASGMAITARHVLGQVLLAELLQHSVPRKTLHS